MTSIHKPILIVIAGPNGSGKTTITSRLLRSEWLEDAVYINPDNVAQKYFTVKVDMPILVSHLAEAIGYRALDRPQTFGITF